jgi:ATP-dependent protease ClpP protease subunit
MKSWYRIENIAAAEADVYVYNDIGMYGVSAERFVAELNSITAPVINLHVNSYGGEVFDAFAMFNAIKAHPSTVICYVDGIAASAATYPVMASDEVRIAKNAFLMIHNPLVIAFGEAGDLRKEADFLDKLRESIANIYVDASGQNLATVTDWMDAETWFNAEEAMANGFATSIIADSDDAPTQPKNKAGQYWNSLVVPRVRPTDRAKALGLDSILPPAKPSATADKEKVMTLEEFKALAAANPDAAKELSEPVVQAALNAAKPRPATIEELEAAFPDDASFVLNQAKAKATADQAKIAYSDKLAADLKTARNDAADLRTNLAKLDPASAGLNKALDVPAPVNTPDAKDGAAETAAAVAKKRSDARATAHAARK